MAFEQSGHPARPDRERRQHQRTVRDALVTGNRDPTFERSGGGKAARAGGLVCHGVRLLTAGKQSGKAHANLADGPVGAVFLPKFLSFLQRFTRLLW